LSGAAIVKRTAAQPSLPPKTGMVGALTLPRSTIRQARCEPFGAGCGAQMEKSYAPFAVIQVEVEWEHALN